MMMPQQQETELVRLSNEQLHAQFLEESRLFMALLHGDFDSNQLYEIKARVKNILHILRSRPAEDIN